MDQISIADRMLQQLQLEYFQVHKHNINQAVGIHLYANPNISKDQDSKCDKQQNPHQKQLQEQEQNLQGYQPLGQDNCDYNSSSEDEAFSQEKINQHQLQNAPIQSQSKVQSKEVNGPLNNQEKQQEVLSKNPQQINQMELIEVGPVNEQTFRVPQNQFEIQEEKIKKLTKAMPIEAPEWMANQTLFKQKLEAMFKNVKK